MLSNHSNCGPTGLCNYALWCVSHCDNIIIIEHDNSDIVRSIICWTVSVLILSVAIIVVYAVGSHIKHEIAFIIEMFL